MKKRNLKNVPFVQMTEEESKEAWREIGKPLTNGILQESRQLPASEARDVLLVWYCFREPTTGRWMADEHGHAWTNLTRDAFRIFDLRNWGPTHEWFVMQDIPHFEPMPSTPDPIDPAFERIQAKAFQFRVRKRSA